MLKTQKAVHEMMKVLDLPLPHEDKPGLDGLNLDLYRNLVREESGEFDTAMAALYVLFNRDKFNGGSRLAILSFFHGQKDDVVTENFRNMPDDEFYKEAILYWWTEVVDAICDTIVVLHNTSNAMGIDIEPFFDEVHRTNMLKADGPLRRDGKRLKPEGWKPPRIKEMLMELNRKNGGLDGN